MLRRGVVRLVRRTVSCPPEGLRGLTQISEKGEDHQSTAGGPASPKIKKCLNQAVRLPAQQQTVQHQSGRGRPCSSRTTRRSRCWYGCPSGLSSPWHHCQRTWFRLRAVARLLSVSQSCDMPSVHSMCPCSP